MRGAKLLDSIAAFFVVRNVFVSLVALLTTVFMLSTRHKGCGDMIGIG